MTQERVKPGYIPACPLTRDAIKEDPNFIRDLFGQYVNRGHGALPQYRSVRNGTVVANQCVYNLDGTLNTAPNIMGTADLFGIYAQKGPVADIHAGDFKRHLDFENKPYKEDPEFYNRVHDRMRCKIKIANGMDGAPFTDAEYFKAFDESLAAEIEKEQHPLTKKRAQAIELMKESSRQAKALNAESRTVDVLSLGSLIKALKVAKKALQQFAKEKPKAVVSCPQKAVWQTPSGNTAALYVKGEAIGGVEPGRVTGSAELKAGVFTSQGVGNLGFVGGSYETGLLHGQADGRASAGLTGVGAVGSADAAVFKQGASGFIGKDPNNPFTEIAAEVKLLSAEAKGDVLVGDDGRRVGLALGGKAGASVVSGSVTREWNIPFPFTSWTISSRSSAGGSAKSVGTGAAGHGYYDKKEKRFHLGGFVDGALGIGGSLGLDISIGKKYSSRERLTDW